MDIGSLRTRIVVGRYPSLVESPRNKYRRPPLPRPIGSVLSRVYLAELGRRNRRFDRGVGVTGIGVPVISVGNLSVGGTGKTPMVRRVCRWLEEDGLPPCIAMRGYKAGAEGSDEEREYRDTHPGVWIVAQADRTRGVMHLLSQPEGQSVRAIVLDDGFQHRQIARDFDIVLLDATRNPFADRALPAGWLRELPVALARAHAVVVTHAERADPDMVKMMIDAARAVNPALLCAVAAHRWTGVRVLDGSDAERDEPVEWVKGRAVLAVCGLGNPEPFLRTAAEAVGRPLAGRVVMRDHAVMDRSVCDRIVRVAKACGASTVLTTGKDVVKLRAWGKQIGLVIAAARLEIAFQSGGEDLRAGVLAAASADRIG